MMFRTHLYVSKSTTQSLQELEAYLKEESDYSLFKKNSLSSVQKYHPHQEQSWSLFLEEESKRYQSWDTSERLLLIKAAYFCLKNPVEKGDFAQLIQSALNLKKYNGVRYFYMLFNASVPSQQCTLKIFGQVCRLLVELKDQSDLLDFLKKHLPDINALHKQLQIKYEEYRQAKYPKRGIDELISIFSTKNEIIQFPLSSGELQQLKVQMQRVNQFSETASKLTMIELKEQALHLGKQYKQSNDISLRSHLTALISEAVYRVFKIKPHDTQILSILALLNTPEKLRGRIGQIRAGEGKSTIIAILAAITALKGDFVDIVTSADYLAVRDAKKYKPFFEELGLTVSHICGTEVKKEQFHGQILYGTNTDYEFAYLRDGLYRQHLRQSARDGQIQPRTFDTAIVDEVDNLFLDTALNSARMSMPSDENITWIYEPIYKKVEENPNIKSEELRTYLLNYEQGKYREDVLTVSTKRMRDWIVSAIEAIHFKSEGVDYVVKAKHNEISESKEEELDIVINDYQNTGRFQEGSQWSNGLHQFLEVKHNLQIKAESLTAGSLSHPTYFGMYRHILALTGTMGEAVERAEIEAIYKVDCFDVPPHFPSQLMTFPPEFYLNNTDHFEALLKRIREMHQKKRPCLILFKTINDSNQFSQFLTQRRFDHQVLNAVQRESEEYLIKQAGETGVGTVATNTAGRGTDIELTPDSLEAKGLHQIFAFYPESSLRVEEQGKRRAARQGQPGSCEMILCYADPAIQSLFTNALQKNNQELEDPSMILAQIQFFQPDRPATEKIKILNSLRTKKIENESKLRYQGSLKEMVYFEKLQFYFKQLASVETLFNSNEFKTECLNFCQSFQGFANLNSSPLTLSKDWELIYVLTKNLLIRQSKEEKVDWSTFYDIFQKLYFNQIMEQWSVFYNQLHHEINTNDIEEVKKQMNSFFSKAQLKLDEYLSLAEGEESKNIDLKKKIFNCLERILQKVKTELQILSVQSEPSISKISLFRQPETLVTAKVDPSGLNLSNQH